MSEEFKFDGMNENAKDTADMTQQEGKGAVDGQQASDVVQSTAQGAGQVKTSDAVQSTGGSQAQTSGAAQGAGQSQPVGGTTYSWVNPKLQQGGRNAYSGQGTQGGTNAYSGQGAQGGTNAYSGQAAQGGRNASVGQGFQSGTNASAGQGFQQGANASSGQSSWQTNYQYSTGQAGQNGGQHTGFAAPGKAKRVKKVRTKKVRKPMGMGKKWMVNVSMALVFGLVAGGVFYGVNRVGGSFNGTSAAETTVTPTLATTETSGDSVTTSSSSSSSTSSVATVAANCMPSLVTISTMSVEEMQSFFGGTQSYEVEGAGTGVIVGQNDTELLIATNDHVVSGASELSVGFIDETSVEAQIKGTDSDNDLAVVAVKLADISDDTMSQIKVATLGNSDDLVLGEQVVAIGNALGYGQSVTSGYVSALNRDLTLSDGNGSTYTSTGLIQTDAPINSGNSGGALLNMKGELIGINEAKSSSTSSGTTVDGIGFAIPISKAEPILEGLMSLTTREKVSDDQASYLGITCADVSSSISEMYNMPTGVCVTDVVEGSPADEAGVKKGDVLQKLDGREISDYSTLKDVLQYYAAGEEVEIVVQRSNEGEYVEKTLTITLGSASDKPQTESSDDSGNSNNSDNSGNYGDSGNSGNGWQMPGSGN